MSGFWPCRLMWSLKHDQRAFAVLEVDASGGIGQNDGTDAHARENANRERHFSRRVAFVLVHATLHDRERNPFDASDDQATNVADGCAPRVMQYVFVGDGGGVAYFIGEAAKS